VDEHATSWVNDTVATRGKLWEFAYAFDAPPDRIVRFRRNGPILNVGAAGSPVTITTDGGCMIRAATPALIDVPEQPCRPAAAAPAAKRAKKRKTCGKKAKKRAKKNRAKKRKKCRSARRLVHRPGR
jgi:hypothetical protein